MKQVLSMLFIFISVALSAQKQTQKETPLYTICNSAGVGTIIFSQSDLKTCEMLLKPIEKDDKISSFVLTSMINGTMMDMKWSGPGNSDFADILKAQKSGSKVYIGKVKILRGDKLIAAPNSIIQFK